MRARPSSSELLAWSLVGLGVGLVAGVGLAGWLGPSRPREDAPSLDPERAFRAPRPLKAAAAERAVERALAADPEFKSLTLKALAVGPGVVELHGWVPTRASRARAMRRAAPVEGIESLINCLLVRGEDGPAEPLLDATDQPA
jgi:BON domain-containing protein